jgi:hypothetical protein
MSCRRLLWVVTLLVNVTAYSKQSTYRKHVCTSRKVHVCHTMGYKVRTPITYVHVEKYVHGTIIYEVHTGRDVSRLYQDIRSDSTGNLQDWLTGKKNQLFSPLQHICFFGIYRIQLTLLFH